MSGNNQNDDDLKRRLRKHNDERLYLEADELMCEAADRIEQLESERDELMACLNLIYSWANNWDSEFMNDPDWINTDYPRIQAAIAKLKGQS